MKNRKKISTIITAAMLASTVSTPVSAAKITEITSDSVTIPSNFEIVEETQEETEAQGGSGTADNATEYAGEIKVNATYKEYMESDKVISADVTWDSMNFKYIASNQGTWNPADHTYTDTDKTGWNKTSSAITVTNHSNLALTAGLSFKPADGQDEISGSFDNTILSLDNAATKALEDPNNAPSKNATFSIKGSLTKDLDIGTITVGITDTAVVTNVDILREVFANGGTAMLCGTTSMKSDPDQMHPTNYSYSEVKKDVMLNLNGQTLNTNGLEIASESTLTVNGSGRLNGYASGNYTFKNSGNLVIENGNFVSSNDGIIDTESSTGTTVINGGTFNKDKRGYIFSIMDGGTLTVNSGTFNHSQSTDPGSSAMFQMDSGSVTINDGSFTLQNGIPLIDVVSTSTKSSITINGGTFTLQDGASLVYGITSGLTIKIKGGTFNINPSAYVADGYKAVNSDGTWTVQPQ